MRDSAGTLLGVDATIGTWDKEWVRQAKVRAKMDGYGIVGARQVADGGKITDRIVARGLAGAGSWCMGTVCRVRQLGHGQRSACSAAGQHLDTIGRTKRKRRWRGLRVTSLSLCVIDPGVFAAHILSLSGTT